MPLSSSSRRGSTPNGPVTRISPGAPDATGAPFMGTAGAENVRPSSVMAKCAHLRAFGGSYLGNEKWSMSGVGEGDELALLEGFPSVSVVFNSLPSGSQAVIRDITNQMGEGMAQYVEVDMG